MREANREGRKAGVIEILETRLAPATFINPYLVSYIDEDGDHVRIAISEPLFKRSLEGFVMESRGEGEVLSELHLPPAAQGASLQILARAAADGDGNGEANVGLIEARAQLRTVTVDGDLAALQTRNIFGDGMQMLHVKSLGAHFDPLNRGGYLPAAEIRGGLGWLIVERDIANERVKILGAGEGGSLGHAYVGGSLLGGSIEAHAGIGSLSLHGDLRGSEAGQSGFISAGQGAGSIVIHGSVYGGDGDRSGLIQIGGVRGLNRIEVRGDIVGGRGEDSGALQVNHLLAHATLRGSIMGAGGEGSGRISAGKIGHLVVLGDLIGGTARPPVFAEDFEGSGVILAHGDIASADVRGDIRGGGDGLVSGALVALGRLRKIHVGGDLVGGGATTSGIFGLHGFDSVRVEGSVIGGSGGESGAIRSGYMGQGTYDPSGSAWIGGSIIGGTGYITGWVGGETSTQSVYVGGSVIGGAAGEYSGAIASRHLGHAVVKGSLVGGGATGSGAIFADDEIGSLEIDGSMVGGDGSLSSYLQLGKVGRLLIRGNIVGGVGALSGYASMGDVSNVEIRGSIRGGTGDMTGTLSFVRADYVHVGGDITGVRTLYGVQNFNVYSGTIVGDRLGHLQIDGSISASETASVSDGPSYAVVIAGRSGTVEIRGTVSGTAENRIGITAGSGSLGNGVYPRDSRLFARAGIDSLRIAGNVAFAEITAGYSATESSSNADAHIGKLFVGGAWSASSASAGIRPGPDHHIGTDDDAVITSSSFGVQDSAARSRIASIVIRGAVLGTAAPGDGYAFEAEQIGSAIIGLHPRPLTGHRDDLSLAPATGDVRLRELRPTKA